MNFLLRKPFSLMIRPARQNHAQCWSICPVHAPGHVKWLQLFFCIFFSVAENNAAMASALFNALGALTGGDMWEAAENCREMFDKGGYYYEKVVNDLGPLQPNQHCTLPVFPNKVSD